MESVFLLQYSLDATVVVVELVLVFPGSRPQHICGSCVDRIKETSRLCFHISDKGCVEGWKFALKFLYHFCLTMSFVSLDTFSRLGALMPKGLLGEMIR